MRNCDNIYTDDNCNIIIQEELKEGFIYAYLIQYQSASENIINSTIIKDSEDPVSFNYGLDGFYTICRLEVPTNPTNVYYYRNGIFYKNINPVDVRELLESGFITKEYQYYFCTCRLKKCYIKVCQEIFNKRATISCNTDGIDKFLVYKRDLLSSTLNVINYMVEMGQYIEASRLLERVTGCNGLCEQNKTDCGCGKM